MFSHITIGVTDVARATDFYAPILEVLGLTLKFSDDRWSGWKHPQEDRPLFVITRPFDDQRPAPGNGNMVAFLAESRSLVQRCYHMAIACGGTDAGQPGLRPQYHAHFYGAYFRDLDGNKICICCHAPE
ncbi:VOC family protein [Rhizobium sp. CFBP 8762]|uniref:VOC family protein n=1 Tax=Rhizobium sp. CFBP 8762 TaxID=2775279 RepID=UPI001786C3D3|nr:VOC family protein [Rhizobium sp. CFBP 8762]MBD8554430.1 VOC family protein [Rhizobium sp. CFBP 8762]